MPVQDTHSFEKNGAGNMNHFWTQKSRHMMNVFRMDDEGDSVSLVIDAKTLEIDAPSIDVTTSVRISDADLRKLIEFGQEILREREA